MSEKNKSVCSKHRRHRIGGEYNITNMTLDELDKFNEQMSAAAHTALETHCPSCAKIEAEQNAKVHETSAGEMPNSELAHTSKEL